MATRVNTRFVICLIAALAVIVGGAVGYYYYFLPQNAPELVARGDELMRQGASKRALGHYVKALRTDETNIAYIDKTLNALELAPVESTNEARDRIFSSIRQLLRDATVQQPNDNERFIRLYEFELRIGRLFNDTDRLYELTSSKLNTAPDNLTARKYRGIAQVHRLSSAMTETSRQQAREDLATVREQNPEDAQVPYYLARWHLWEAQHIQREDVQQAVALRDKALALSRELLEVDPEDPNRRLKYLMIQVQAQAEITEQMRALAEQLTQQLIENPEPRRHVRQLANIWPRLDKRPINTATAPASDGADEGAPVTTTASPAGIINVANSAVGKTRGKQRARELLEAVSAKRPNEPAYLVQLGLLLTSMGDNDAAIDAYESVREQSGAAPPIMYLRQRQLQPVATERLALLMLGRAREAQRDGDDQQQQAAAERVASLIDELEQQTPNNPAVDAMRGGLAIVQERWREASVHLEQARAAYQTPPVRVLLWAATAHDNLGQKGAAADRLRSILTRAARAARAEDQRAPTDNPLLGRQLAAVRRMFAGIELDNGRADEAAPYIAQLRENWPDDPSVQALQVRLHAARGELEAARELYTQLPGETGEALKTLAAAHLVAGERDALADMLVQRLASTPGDVPAVEMLVRMAPDVAKQQNIIEAARATDRLDENDKQTLDVLAAQLEGAEQRAQQALLKQLQQRGDLNEDALRFQFETGQAQRSDDWERFRALVQQAAGQQSDDETGDEASDEASDALLLFRQFQLAIHDKNWQRAEALARTAGERDLDLAQGAFFMARLATARGSLDEASAHFRRGLEARPVYADGWRRFGDLQLRRDDLAEAANSYQQAVSQQPSNIRARLGLAEVHERRGNRAEALEQWRAAVERQPLNTSLVDRYVVYELQHGNPGRAVAACQRLANLQPQNLGNRRRLALLQARTNQADRARETAQQLIADDGESRTNVATLAQVHRLTGQPRAGARVLNAYVQQRGGDAVAADYAALGVYLYQTGDINGANEALSEALRREDPEMRPVTRELAQMLMERGQHERAAALFKRAHEAQPDDQRIAGQYAFTLIRAGAIDQAEPIVAQVTDENKRNVLRGMIATARGDFEQAVQRLTEAIEAGSDGALAHFERARARASLGAYDDAMSDLMRVLELKPDFLRARAMRAALHARDGELGEAQEQMRRVLDRQPGRHEARLRLAELYVAGNALSQAARVLAEGQRRDPDNPVWPRRLADVEMRRGNPDTAREHQARVVELAQTPSDVLDLARLHLATDDAPGALAVLDEHAGALSGAAMGHALRGRAHAMLGNGPEAEAAFADGLNACQHLRDLRYIAREMSRAYDASSVIAQLESAEAPRALWRQIVAADLERGADRPDAAAQRLTPLRGEAEQAEKLTQWHYHYVLARALHQADDYSKARAEYEKLLALNPRNRVALNDFAYLLADRLNEPRRAVRMAQQAVAQQPNDARLLDTLGWAQYHAGQLDDARRTLERSLRLDPLAESYLHLAYVHESLGNADARRQHLEQATVLAEQTDKQTVLEEARRLLGQDSSSSRNGEATQ